MKMPGSLHRFASSESWHHEVWHKLKAAASRSPTLRPFRSSAAVSAVWIEKGLGMVVTGFIPNPLGEVNEYWPTTPEMLISFGIYAMGFLVLTGLYKIAVSVREDLEQA